MELLLLTIAKLLDNASQSLTSKLYDGKTFDQIEIYQCTTGEEPTCIAKHTYFNVLVSGHRHISGSHGVTELIELAYTRYESGFSTRNSQNEVQSTSYVGYDLHSAEKI